MNKYFYYLFFRKKSMNIATVKDLTILNSADASRLGFWFSWSGTRFGHWGFWKLQVTLMCSHVWKPLRKRMLLKYLSIPFWQVENCKRECTCRCKYRSRGSPKPRPCQFTVLCKCHGITGSRWLTHVSGGPLAEMIRGGFLVPTDLDCDLHLKGTLHRHSFQAAALSSFH